MSQPVITRTIPPAFLSKTITSKRPAGATDMAYLRAKEVQCYGIGPAIDEEDGPKGFGSHSDQERILETELHRFVRFNWEVVTALAARGK
jgi:hypothetical protein